MKFIADGMLGKLAKWLRILGYDTLYYRNLSDEELLQKALETQRILLTRDTKLFEKVPSDKALFIESDHVKEQVQQVIRSTHLDLSSNVLTRCIVCNTSLERIEKSEVETRVPEFVYHTQTDFSRCPCCGKIYWKGSHQANITKKIEQLTKN